MLAGDKKGRHFLLYVIGIALFIVLLPVIAVYGLFGWMAGGAEDIVNYEMIYDHLPTEQREQMEQYNGELEQIALTFGNNGLSQIEISQAKTIYLSCLTGKETVIDAYCGTGTIGIIASKYAKEVLGVELNKDAIRDAVTNAKRNDIKNIKFVNDDAGKYMVALAEQNEKVDVVIMDPPRSGSDEAFLSSVVKLSPKRVVYVSCGPDTLARDLKYLTKKGYCVEEATPFDMFPFTNHTEMVVALSKK